MKHTWLISLGDYSTDDYGNRGEFQKQLIWIVFVLATFFIQITFMNMLIAIMSGIFDKIMAKEEQAKTKARLDLISDLGSIFRFGKYIRSNSQGSNYLLVVKPKSRQFDPSIDEKLD